MELLERIESQIHSTRLPLVAITVAAVPCPDTPVIMTLHWHGFVREKLIDDSSAQTVSYTPLPSSALQVNESWGDVRALDRATLDAAWELGAWDVSRAEAPSCTRPGADTREAIDCLKAFGSFPWGVNGNDVVVADTPDADDLVAVAAERGYLMWLFRPVHGGIWKDVADDATLRPDGTREPPCPVNLIPALAGKARKTVYRFGVSQGRAGSSLVM
ncbi:MAG: diguanylate cyclase [Betaproteobacteria bacterium]|nr:diguanylate cyclase [Betaproteobacteria bacterium]